MRNKVLGARKTFELIEELKETVETFAAREDRLVRGHRLSYSTAKKEWEEATEAESARLGQLLQEAEAGYVRRKEELEARYEHRKQRIRQAHRNVKTRILKDIEGQEGNRKFELQKDMLRISRERDALVADIEARFDQWDAVAAEYAAAFARQRKAVRNSFKGYASFRRMLIPSGKTDAEPETVDVSGSEEALVESLEERKSRVGQGLVQFRKLGLPKFFRFFPLTLIIVLLVFAHVGAVLLLPQAGIEAFGWTAAAISLALTVGVAFVIHLAGGRQARARAESLAAEVNEARAFGDACVAEFEQRRKREQDVLNTELKEQARQFDRNWKKNIEKAVLRRRSQPGEIDEKQARANSLNEKLHRQRMARLEPEYSDYARRLQNASATKLDELRTNFETHQKTAEENFVKSWDTLEKEWKEQSAALFAAIQEINERDAREFPDWTDESWQSWTPPSEFPVAARFGRMQVDLNELTEGKIPADERLALPGPTEFSVPLNLKYPLEGSLILETKTAGRDQAAATLNNLILRLLTKAPPGKVSFTIIDPVGLGENFAGIMHLADFEESLIHNRIWTQTSQIEQRLGELNEHMEKVIQMYLRNEYETITEYNKQAGNIAEKYHVVVIADFPAGFSEVAAKRLQSIASSGARCGVYAFIHWDQRHAVPQDLVAEDLRQSGIPVTLGQNLITLFGKRLPGVTPVLDSPPDSATAIELVQRIGRSSIDANRVEVPFSHVNPPESERWTLDTTNELRVPIGRTGATKLQYLAIGKGTCQHTLIAGKTGSGKSTLFHVIISNLALWAAPDQVEFYLVDFKKGVEFKCYATKKLPHARVIAIESDREFGLSVLQRVDDELKRRGDLFRKLGVQDIPGYKRAGGAEPMPRSLLMIDEFQEFFVQDDRISQNAAVLLDRIVRQGRAFGIHVILGSQTLGGAYTLARTTLGQMVIRIALQCNEADSYLIMDDNNPAARLLTRPGEGIYNDAAGAMEGNSPFQVVWLPEEVRDEALDVAHEMAVEAAAEGKPAGSAPIVFEGNAPADIWENQVLLDRLHAKSIQTAAESRAWMGAPNSIKGPTEAVFRRQSGNNLLIVGQRDESALAILAVSMVSLATQFAAGKVRFIVVDGHPPGSSEKVFLESVIDAIPHDARLCSAGELAEAINELATRIKQGGEDEGAASDLPTTFLIINGLQRFKKLRFEEDFGFSMDETESGGNPGTQLNDIICEGPGLGVHLIAAVDTYNNVNRFLSRKAISEFEMRVVFQMSAADSSSLIDNPKASGLGLNRALFYNEQEGYLETFRPYALPDHAWVEEVEQHLRRLIGESAVA